MVDRVQALKLEAPDTGGTEEDAFPTGLNRNEDYLDCRGIAYQSPTSNDDSVRTERDAQNNLCFVDPYAGVVKLADLSASANHKAVRDLIHFIDDGPADGFASGAYKETLPAGSPFPTQEVWWSSVAKTRKIVELLLTRDAMQRPVVEQWKMYDQNGVLILTLTDSVGYSGVFEINRTRVWTSP